MGSARVGSGRLGYRVSPKHYGWNGWLADYPTRARKGRKEKCGMRGRIRRALLANGCSAKAEASAAIPCTFPSKTLIHHHITWFVLIGTFSISSRSLAISYGGLYISSGLQKNDQSLSISSNFYVCCHNSENRSQH